ncbi:DEDD protein, partial [Pachyramphus minor]|nr:DEDD protein [Pachyramphus minor]
VCPDLVDKYLEETSIRYVTPRAPGETPPGLGHPPKSGGGIWGPPLWGFSGIIPIFHPWIPWECRDAPGTAQEVGVSHNHPHSPPKTPLIFGIPPSDIRLRVRAEYCQHDSALQGNVFSNKQEPLERQFERFNQANTILKSRDLGSIICDIKFSELTYLDAFWRDYINGSLLEALKGVFITDSLKQAVGHEAIKLLVNVDEEDYEVGRQKLLRNLMLQTAP